MEGAGRLHLAAMAGGSVPALPFGSAAAPPLCWAGRIRVGGARLAEGPGGRSARVAEAGGV